MSVSKRLLTAMIVAIWACTVLAGSASAATRYASPTGSGASCAAASPCTLSTAINAAGMNDEIVALPGEYGSPAIPISGIENTLDNLTLRGLSAFEKPLIHVTGNNGIRLGYSSQVTDVRVMHYGLVTAVYAIEGLFTRTELSSSTDYSTCMAASSYVNSVCVNSAADSAAVGSFAGAGGTTSLSVSTFRNLTAWASGTSSVGLEASHTGGFRAEFRVHNSILHGTEASAKLTTDGVNSSTATLVTNSSNFTTVTSIGAGSSHVETPGALNQSAAPVLADPTNGDFRPLAGSPTINAGKDAESSGAQDFSGGDRIQGIAVDIGAYEFPEAKAPSAPTPVVTKLKLAPRSFRIAKRGATFQTASKLPKKKRGQPSIGTLLSLDLSVVSRIEFSIERVQKGRRTGSKCGRPTRKNLKGRRCTYTKAVRGKQTLDGKLGANSFYFNGRWSPRIGAGSYRLTAKPVGGSGAVTTFKIVR